MAWCNLRNSEEDIGRLYQTYGYELTPRRLLHAYEFVNKKRQDEGLPPIPLPPILSDPQLLSDAKMLVELYQDINAVDVLANMKNHLKKSAKK